MGLFNRAGDCSLARTGRSEKEIPQEMLNGIWREYHRLKGTNSDATVGTVRLVTRRDGTWFLMDPEHDIGDTMPICSLELRDLMLGVAKEAKCTVRYSTYGSKTALCFAPKPKKKSPKSK